MNLTRTTVITAASLAAALALGACGSSTEVTKPVAQSATTAVPYQPGGAASTTPTTKAPAQAHVGATLHITGYGNEAADVTLAQVIAPATGSFGPPTDDSGNPNGDLVRGHRVHREEHLLGRPPGRRQLGRVGDRVRRPVVLALV